MSCFIIIPIINEMDQISNTEKKTGAASQRKLKKYSPYTWQDYFDESLDISIPDTSDISFFFFI